MFKYLLVDHAVPAMCRNLAAAKLRAEMRYGITVDGETRVPHKASVMSSTRRTATPARYISIKASSTELLVPAKAYIGRRRTDPGGVVCR